MIAANKEMILEIAADTIHIADKEKQWQIASHKLIVQLGFFKCTKIICPTNTKDWPLN